MPNWCYTNIVINHHNKTKLEELSKKIIEWSHKDFCDNGFHDGWLGNIVGNSGIANPLDKDSPRCRGTLTSIYYEHEQINISTETAWAPMMQMWVMLCNKYLPDADIWFSAEEPGCELFESNDPDVIGKYYIDIWEPPEEFENEESMWDAGEDVAIDFLQRVLKTDEKDINKLLEMQDELDDRWFGVHVWSECDVNDCE